MERYGHLAGVIPVDEIDDMFESNVIGGTSSIDCVRLASNTPEGTVNLTVRIEFCPSAACTYSCRL
ncbi:MAG: hypothetical protein WBK46_05245 [Ruminococcus flavefaciens]|uniref:Lantipeptide Flvbeta.h n=1 Tax=Ruminococcus flavefaciens TaxID=1265 RepID=LAN2H_RUMFL|nr:RecName: Full=Lantipeptide Flvbeta.h; Flags: Precursor [Ruminococcus flavefaciens]OPZ22380.1 MAG: hypothetical protein BWZ04_00145 [Firmicutes bacterium ADurb.BinA205]HOC32832.1 hypothetical protein [Ruminococcus flavefaciens]HQM00531.1 hypothetical protein [Ruminococcus flavefaciens]